MANDPFTVLDAAEVTKQSLIRDHASRMQRGPKISLPNGLRESATPYIGMQFQTDDSRKLLSEPESMLKRPNPNCKYIWRVRSEPRTAAMVRSGVLRPVEMEEINPLDPTAEIVDLVTPTGSYVIWETLALFEMQPEFIYKYYGEPVDRAKNRLASQAVEFQDSVEETTRNHYTGQMEVTPVNTSR